MEFETFLVTRSHKKCKMRRHKENHSGFWRCDRVKGSSICLSGIYNYSSKGIDGWECRQCDFDLCMKCAKADKFIEMHENREDWAYSSSEKVKVRLTYIFNVFTCWIAYWIHEACKIHLSFSSREFHCTQVYLNYSNIRLVQEFHPCINAHVLTLTCISKSC